MFIFHVKQTITFRHEKLTDHCALVSSLLSVLVRVVLSITTVLRNHVLGSKKKAPLHTRVFFKYIAHELHQEGRLLAVSLFANASAKGRFRRKRVGTRVTRPCLVPISCSFKRRLIITIFERKPDYQQFAKRETLKRLRPLAVLSYLLWFLNAVAFLALCTKK